MTQIINPAPPLTPQQESKWRKLINVFVDENDKGWGDKLTETQIRIIEIIARRKYPRTQLILPTQYGKSLSVALGVLLRVTLYKEKWALVAPSQDKAAIIMDYIIEHIFDDNLFRERLEFYDTKEKLKQQRSRGRITFRDAGEVRVFSADARNTKGTKKALLGFGSANVVLDESAQIPDELYSTVKRMLGGTKDNFLLEIGNPSFRNHFFRTWQGKRYKKVFMDVYSALEEGRYTQDYINEMREEAGFEWMYECKFPEEGEELPGGYRQLISPITLENAFIDDELPIVEGDRPILGIDVAGTGSAQTVYVIRWPKTGFAKKLIALDDEDTELQASQAELLIKQYNIGEYHIAIDAGGVGHGLAYILESRGYLIKKVLFGEKASEKGFANIKAELFWRSRTWLKSGDGKVVRDDSFLELNLINYKQNSSFKVQIEPKEDMIKRKSAVGESVKSPDTADAFALTFVDVSKIVDEEDIDFD